MRAVVSKRQGTVLAAFALVLACGMTTGCGWSPTGKASYRPPFSPIEISVNTKGQISFTVGEELVTPIGTFAIGADIDRAPDDATLLVIAHPSSSGPVQDRFTIASTQTLGVCFDGSAYGEFTEHRIFLQAFDTGSTIRIVPSGTKCPRPPRQQVQPDRAGGGGQWAPAQVQVGNTRLGVLVADTTDKITHGRSGFILALQNGLDGVLYLLPAPQWYDPDTGGGAFIFAGYRFPPEVHFFDANGRYWAGGPVAACAADGHGCPPYFAALWGNPVPYQYVLELVPGRLGAVAPGTPLLA